VDLGSQAYSLSVGATRAFQRSLTFCNNTTVILISSTQVRHMSTTQQSDSCHQNNSHTRVINRTVRLMSSKQQSDSWSTTHLQYTTDCRLHYLNLLVDLFEHGWDDERPLHGLDLIPCGPDVSQEDLFAFRINGYRGYQRTVSNYMLYIKTNTSAKRLNSHMKSCYQMFLSFPTPNHEHRELRQPLFRPNTQVITWCMVCRSKSMRPVNQKLLWYKSQ